MDKKVDVKQPVHWTKQFLPVKNLGRGEFKKNAFWPPTKPKMKIEIIDPDER